MTNICFLIFAQIRAKFRLFLLCWSVFYFQSTRSNLGEQVSLNKNFCSALGCISILIFDNFFISWLTFSLQLADSFSAADETFQTFFFFVGKLFWKLFKQNSKPLFFVSCVQKFFTLNTKKLNRFSHETQIKIRRKFSKVKPKLNHKLKQNLQKPNRNPRKNFQNQIKPQSKPNRKKNKLRRNRIENKINFIVTLDVLCYNQLDKLE